METADTMYTIWTELPFSLQKAIPWTSVPYFSLSENQYQ
jgi:hypothetical protein